MKHALLATTALVLTSGFASAGDVMTAKDTSALTISGYGRFGLSSDDSRDKITPGANNTVVHERLRFDFKATKTTDSGVTFGGKFRMQWDALNGGRGAGMTTNQGQIFVSYGGLTVSVGNVGGAMDDAALLYASEVGFESTSFGDPNGDFFFYVTGSAPVSRMGVNVAYSAGDFGGEISYITNDQATSANTTSELAISGNYKFGAFTVSAAYSDIKIDATNTDISDWFIGAAYALDADTTIGLNYIDNDKTHTNKGTRTVLYGSKAFGAFGVTAYVAADDSDGLDNKTAFGLGGSYDLGGAKLYGSVEKGYGVANTISAPTVASVGVKFDF